MVAEPVCDSVGEDSVHLWSNILKGVSTTGLRKLSQTKGLLVLGDNGIGKTSLMCRLNHKSKMGMSPGLEYHYIDIKDEARDDQAVLNVWILDGEVGYTPLLKYALKKENFADCMALITVSMSEPWNIMEQLEKWIDILQRYIKHLDLPIEELGEFKNSLVRHFREYTEPESILVNSPLSNQSKLTNLTPVVPTSIRSANPLHPATAALLGLTNPAKVEFQPDAVVETEEKSTSRSLTASAEVPITQGALENNLGIPLIVVVTKVDLMDALEKEHNLTEEQFDLIQMHIRRFCLSYGAALFYVSSKEEKNCELLKNYIQHRIYGFPFIHNADVVEKDRIFVPAGWDNLKKISILEENLAKFNPGDAYSSVIPRPEEESLPPREPEVHAMDEQNFLARLSVTLQREASSGGTGPSGDNSLMDDIGHTPVGVFDKLGPNITGATSGRTSMGSPRTPASLRSKVGPGAPGSVGMSGNTSENVLASFFNNLLSKRPANASPAGSNSPSVVSDATVDKLSLSSKEMQSELERLSKTPNKEDSVETTIEPVSDDPTLQTPEKIKNDPDKQTHEPIEMKPDIEDQTVATNPAEEK